MTPRGIKAVIFDIGGVVMRSPFIGIAKYEREHGIPENYLNCSIVGRGPQGAWQRFERGEMDLFSFYQDFGDDLSDTMNGNIWYTAYCNRRGLECPELPQTLEVNGRELFGAMMRESGTYDPHIKLAIHCIRAAGKHKIIALTNNFARVNVPEEESAFLGWDNGVTPSHLRELFDDFCDSSTLGMRKPDPEFYLLACKRSDVRPEEVVFLDDIGINLKAGKKLGMTTIQVTIGKTFEAVKELECVLGLNLADLPINVKL